MKGLRQAVAAQFDAEQTLHEQRLASLEKEIQRLRADLKRRSERRKEIIAGRIDRLLESTTRPAGP